LQLEALEKTIGQQQRELKELNEQNHQQLEAFNQTKQDLQMKLDKVWSLGKLKEHGLLSNVQQSFLLIFWISSSCHLFEGTVFQTLVLFSSSGDNVK